MMTFDVVSVSCYAGIASVLVELGSKAIKFQCFKADLRETLDKFESVAIGQLDREALESLQIRAEAL